MYCNCLCTKRNYLQVVRWIFCGDGLNFSKGIYVEVVQVENIHIFVGREGCKATVPLQISLFWALNLSLCGKN